MINLDDLTQEQYVEVLRENYFLDAKFGTLEERLAIIDVLMEHFGMDKNREQIAFILSNYPRQIAEACAGAGKTTSCIIKVLSHCMFKDIEADKTVMLTYTNESTKDLEYKMDKAYTLLGQLEFSSIKLDGHIRIRTLHSFFTDLIYEYAPQLGIKIINKRILLLNNAERINYMNQVLEALVKADKITCKVHESLANNLLSLYQQVKEKDIYNVPEMWNTCSSFKLVSTMVFEEIIKIFTVYEKLKRGNQIVEFCEYASLCSQLFDNKDVLTRWRRFYKYVFVDEYQDVTESQINVIKKLIIGSDDGMLVAIGDGDQSIYGFRGAHANGCVNFPKEFSVDGSAVCVATMTLNRRCPKLILSKARRIIETVNIRLDKKLRTDIPGGQFEITEVSNYRDEAEFVTKILNEMNDAELRDTVVAYRSNRSSRFLKKMVEDQKIRIKSSNSIKDTFEETIKGAIELLYDTANMALAEKFLYKMTPKGKGFGLQEIRQVIRAEKERRKEGYVQRDIFELDFTSTTATQLFLDEMKNLSMISKAVRGEFKSKGYANKMSYFVPPLVFSFLKKYYLAWQDAKSDTEGSEHIFGGQEFSEITDEYAKSIYEEYTQDVTYSEFRRNLLYKKELLENTLREVNFSTFHGLKGLEFKNVIVIDLRDSIFPGYELSQATNFGGKFIEMADDEAKRLLYVVMTRSKDKLTMCFRDKEPSRYIAYLTDEDSNTASEDDIVEDLFTFGDVGEVLPVDETREFEIVQSKVEVFKKSSSLDRWLQK